MEYLIHILVLITPYQVLSLSLDLLLGYTGLLSVAHASFFGVGAYVSAILSIRFGLPVLVTTVMSVAIGGLVAASFGYVTASLRGDYFVLSTFAMQTLFYDLANNLTSLTGGAAGLGGIPAMKVFSHALSQPWEVFGLTSAYLLISYWIYRNITRGPMGRVLRAIREDEVFAQSLGTNTARYKTNVLAVSGALAGGAGALYGQYITFIDPGSFSVAQSIALIAMVVVGGPATRFGPMIGSAVLIAAPELLRFVGVPSSALGNVRQILYGGIIIGVTLRNTTILGDAS